MILIRPQRATAALCGLPNIHLAAAAASPFHAPLLPPTLPLHSHSGPDRVAIMGLKAQGVPKEFNGPFGLRTCFTRLRAGVIWI